MFNMGAHCMQLTSVYNLLDRFRDHLNILKQDINICTHKYSSWNVPAPTYTAFQLYENVHRHLQSQS